MSSEDSIRVSDAERDMAVAALGDHHAAGRVSMAELEERVEAAYRSITRADLHRVLADLPTPSRAEPRHAGGSGWCAGSGQAWAPWLVTGLICLTVWLLMSIGSGEVAYFWPVWVVGPWGLVLAARKLTDDRPRTHG